MRRQSAARAGARRRGLCSGAECGVGAPAGISPDFAFATVRATPLASFPSSRCQTAWSSFFPRRVAVRGFILPLSFHVRFASFSTPMRGGGAPGRVTGSSSRLRGATIVLPGDGRAPLGAPRGDFRLWDRRFVFRQCPPESAPRLRPRPSIGARPIGSPPPAAAVRDRRPGTPHPAQPSGRHRRHPS
jgi:hypothetical protein